MSTNRFPGIGKKQPSGKDFNFYEKVIVTETDYGSNSVDLVQPNIVIPFVTQRSYDS